MRGARRTPRDLRRLTLGQNFLRLRAAERFVAEAGVNPGELVVDVGAESGAISRDLLRRGARVIAVEADPDRTGRLRDLADALGRSRMRVAEGPTGGP